MDPSAAACSVRRTAHASPYHDSAVFFLFCHWWPWPLAFDLDIQTPPSEGPSTSTLWISRKSVKRFPTYLRHKQKNKKKLQTPLKTEPYFNATKILTQMQSSWPPKGNCLHKHTSYVVFAYSLPPVQLPNIRKGIFCSVDHSESKRSSPFHAHMNFHRISVVYR